MDNEAKERAYAIQRRLEEDAARRRAADEASILSEFVQGMATMRDGMSLSPSSDHEFTRDYLNCYRSCSPSPSPEEAVEQQQQEQQLELLHSMRNAALKTVLRSFKRRQVDDRYDCGRRSFVRWRLNMLTSRRETDSNDSIQRRFRRFLEEKPVTVRARPRLHMHLRTPAHACTCLD